MTKSSDAEIGSMSSVTARRATADISELCDTCGEYAVSPENEPITHRDSGVFAAGRDTVTSLFAAQAARTPEAVAVSLGSSGLTYGELDRKAEDLAARLAAEGAGPGAIVGLSLPRSLDLVVALLGILKSGAAYLPLDPAYPADRLVYMVEDADAALVVATPQAGAWLPAGRRRLDPDGGESDPSAKEGGRGGPAPTDLAYVIYTSGSTGRPKGVAIEHAAVTRLFGATRAWFGFGPRDVWTLFHSVSFDFSVWEIWGALFHGGRLVIVPDSATRDPTAFLRLLSEEGVTVLNQTPSAFYGLDRADEDRAGRDELALRHVIFGGEALDPRRLAGWYGRRGEATRFVNMYGITETTVHVTYRLLGPDDARRSGSPIGLPIPDLEILLLDGETMQPVRPGEVGEIFVGGAGLARGYLNRPELTQARFVPHPGRAGARLYRSGDLARLTEAGEYEHLGRADQQIKIRGFRVERGEIEAALLTHPAIRQAAVVLRADAGGPERLVAYLVCGDGERPSPARLKSHLAQGLPEHMLPALYVVVPELPLTVNGKLDQAALPAPGRERPDGPAYIAPRDEAERRLAALIAEGLGLARIGMDDNFFDLGGNSLLMVEIHRRLARDWPALALLDLYRHPNARALAAHLTATRAGASDALARAMARGARGRARPPLSPGVLPAGARHD